MFAFLKDELEARKSRKVFFLQPNLLLNILRNVFFLFVVRKYTLRFLKFSKFISNLILGQIIVSNLTNVHKLAAKTVLDYMKLDIYKKTNMRYSHYSGLPFEMQLLKATK